MSIEAIALASKVQGIDPRDKFVLIALANFADDRMKAWPKQQTVAEWTCYSRKTINLALTELERLGLIVSTQQYRDDGGFRSKVYDLSPLRQVDRPPVTSGNTPLLPNVTPPVTSGNSKNRHKNSHEGTNPLTPLSANADDFDEEEDFSEEEAATPSVKDRTPAKKSELDELMPKLMAAYNENRQSPRGSLPEAQVRSKVRDSAARGFLKDMKRNGLDPVEMVALLTRHLAKDEFYLAKRHGFEAVMRNWSKHKEAASATEGSSDKGKLFLYGERKVRVNYAPTEGFYGVEDVETGNRYSVPRSVLKPIQEAASAPRTGRKPLRRGSTPDDDF